MCGIAGIVAHEPQLEKRVHSMADAISHRGPDDFGLKVWTDHGVALAHRRLAIIDLSPAGHNPMSNEDGAVWIVFNGEIYNFQDLRAELERAGHRFRSHTDTEVILHAYEEWGDEHVQRLRGMFAYAIYDRRPHPAAASTPSNQRCRILLVRDRIGIKPLFYYLNDGLFLFGSELKALLAHPGVDHTLDRSALFDYLTYLYIPAPKTAYRHIRKLPPASMLVWENGEIRHTQYWDVPLHTPLPIHSTGEAVEAITPTLAEAVRIHLCSDVPLGVFLSGGLDSSTVTALMAQTSSGPVRTFSIGFDVREHSELEYARLVADHYQTLHHERTVGVDSIQEMVPRAVWMYDEPYADGSALPTYVVSAITAEQVKVVLSGDGGDEIFAGYRWYTAWLRRQFLRHMALSLPRSVQDTIDTIWPAGRLGRGLLRDLTTEELQRYARRIELFSPSEKRRLFPPAWQREFADYDDYWYFRQYWRPELDPLTRVQYLDLKTYLPDDILTKVDRASMAVSLEVRPPLLDHILVEQVFAVPVQFRAPQGQRKYLLKQIARNLLPNAVIDRPKKGFSSPWTVWFRKERAWVQDRLFTQPWLLRPDAVNRENLFANGPRIWGLLVFQQWLHQVAPITSAVSERSLEGASIGY
ncbi:MAG TPA: asparagine synthase (glutamine-hydrolyzing) [Caldilineaceae bacterium]|nr:asparagine synthase (glutamine-hydrolyzing) [Caldilineaceae bacterium]